ncbi:MAG TPA: hypothetical protein VF789_25525 [Thermoanaerobaculia bacterium]
MRRAPRKGAVLLISGLCLLSLAGCRPKDQTPPAGQPATEPGGQPAAYQPTVDTTCLASQSWITQPNPPGDVPKNASNCEFQQFSWQWFLKLVSPAQPGSNERTFEDNTQYPVLGVDACPGKVSSVQLAQESRGLGVRIRKQRGPAPFKFVLPEDIDQAGSDNPLFDQNGKVVYYNTQYTPNECGITQGIDTGFPNKPGDTVTELKLSWRQITPAEAPRYYSIQATIVSGGTSQQVLLGLVGFHIVKNAPNHPEFIWASFEHKDNAPDCDGTEPIPAAGWSFASAKCAACLNNPYDGDCGSYLSDVCKFNIYQGMNKAANICRAIPNGGGSLENQTNIQSLNTQIAGFLNSLPADNPMAVFKNYFLVGTLWIKNPNSPIAPWFQDGSTALLNTTLESYDQLGGPNNTAANCFTCHNFNGAENTTAISHILPIPTAQQRPGAGGPNTTQQMKK